MLSKLMKQTFVSVEMADIVTLVPWKLGLTISKSTYSMESKPVGVLGPPAKRVGGVTLCVSSTLLSAEGDNHMTIPFFFAFSALYCIYSNEIYKATS
jgi:hypothetical protein